MAKRFLVRHVGNMGDLVFLAPPVLATLKRLHPDCHITFVTAWGYKDRTGHWGKRNQGGFGIHLMMTNPHIDELVHWHDTKLSLTKDICHEDGQQFATWSKTYYEQQKASGEYDGVYELDFGLTPDENPLQHIYKMMDMADESYTNYQLYVTDEDKAVAEVVMGTLPHPRIVLLEGLEGTTTRGWDPGKIPPLTKKIEKNYGVQSLWFGAKYTPEYKGRPLTLRENIALLILCDVGIGVLSGPLHFAAAVGLPTLTLYAGHSIQRAAPAYFLNRYIKNPAQHHRTLLGPDQEPYDLMKTADPNRSLTPAEVARQQYRGWQQPGRQATKSPLSAITVDEVTTVLHDMLSV